MSLPTSDRPERRRERERSGSPPRDSTGDEFSPRYIPEAGQQTFSNPIFRPGESNRPAGFEVRHGRGEERPRSQDQAADFVRRVPLNSLKGCQSYFRQHPEILRETNLDQRYLDPAIRALATGNADSRTQAFSYMEKYTFIKITQLYQQAKRGDFLELLINKDPDATNTFRINFQKVKLDCEKKAPTRLEGLPRQANVEGEDDGLTARTSAVNISSEAPRVVDSRSHGTRAHHQRNTTGHTTQARTSLERLEPVPQDRHGTDPNVQTLRSTQASQSRDHRGGTRGGGTRGGGTSGSDSANSDGSEGGATPRPSSQQIPIYDNRFHRLPTHEWPWFKAGRVFAIKTYSERKSQPDGNRDDFSIERAQTIRGTEVTEYIRRMVVVKARSGFCLAVPINTYGGQGLHKPSFRERNIAAHARIHMLDRNPRWIELDGRPEPQTAKRDIVVRPSTGQQLHAASRVCFERTHSIDYNEKIMKIGTVTDSCIGYLTEYWELENSHPSDQGQSRRRGSGQRGGGRND